VLNGLLLRSKLVLQVLRRGGLRCHGADKALRQAEALGEKWTKAREIAK
jgi:hypothetical protein